MKKIILALAVALSITSCDLDLFPSDAVSAGSMKDPANSSVVTDGTYGLFKAILMFDGMVYSANSYVRHFFQMAEFRADNCCLSDMTPDPLCTALRYTDISTEGNTSYYWWIAYKILLSANSMIDAIPEGQDKLSDHILGENYFIRAIVHLHLMQIYSTPYSQGRDKLGIVLRNSSDCSVTKRATVGECYDLIESDLVKASALMKGGSRRGNNGYVSYEAAMGLLSRVYLYEEKWTECINTVTEVLGGSNPIDHLDMDYVNLFQNSKTSKEVLWCVAMIPSVTDWTDQKGSMGSMFYSPDAPGGQGWAEIYWSRPLLDLFERHPEDLRLSTMFEAYKPEDSMMAYWPIKDNENDFRLNHISENVKKNANGNYEVKGPDEKTYEVETRIVNSYPEYHINYGGVDTRIAIEQTCFPRRTFPVHMMKKFANMDGATNVLNSPIMIRWAEVILNRAEANAHLGNVSEALKDVNVIRQRAGLTGDSQMTEANMAARGYANDILGVVLDERRMELCFEGHRTMDLTRNKLDINREFGGMNPWGIIKYDDKRIPYQIPFGEISVSHIDQNER